MHTNKEIRGLNPEILGDRSLTPPSLEEICVKRSSTQHIPDLRVDLLGIKDFGSQISQWSSGGECFVPISEPRGSCRRCNIRSHVGIMHREQFDFVVIPLLGRRELVAAKSLRVHLDGGMSVVCGEEPETVDPEMLEPSSMVLNVIDHTQLAEGFSAQKQWNLTIDDRSSNDKAFPADLHGNRNRIVSPKQL